MALPDNPDESPTGEPAPAISPVAPAQRPAPIKRGPELRRRLLAQLPKLGLSASTGEADINLLRNEDIQEALELDADDLLVPLETLVPPDRK